MLIIVFSFKEFEQSEDLDISRENLYRLIRYSIGLANSPFLDSDRYQEEFGDISEKSFIGFQTKPTNRPDQSLGIEDFEHLDIDLYENVTMVPGYKMR